MGLNISNTGFNFDEMVNTLYIKHTQFTTKYQIMHSSYASLC